MAEWRVRKRGTDPDLQGYLALAEKTTLGSDNSLVDKPPHSYVGKEAADALYQLRSMAVTGRNNATTEEILEPSEKYFKEFLENIIPEFFPNGKSLFRYMKDGSVEAVLYGTLYPTTDPKKLDKDPLSAYKRRLNSATGKYAWVDGPFGHAFVIRRYPVAQLSLPLGNADAAPKIFREERHSPVFVHIANEGKLEDMKRFWKDSPPSNGFVRFWPIGEYTPANGKNYIKQMGFGEPDEDITLYQRFVTPGDLAKNLTMSTFIEQSVKEIAAKNYACALELEKGARKQGAKKRRQASNIMEAAKRLKEYCQALQGE